MLNKLERQPLAVQAADRLREHIVSGKYLPGQKLPTETLLGELLGVGRSTVREAVSALARSGLLDVRQGSGTYVCELPVDGEPLAVRLRRARISEVQEVRRVLESEIAALAAQRRTAEDLTAMRTALDTREHLLQIGLSDNLGAFLEADLAFHQAIAHACGNLVLGDLYSSFLAVIHASLLSLNTDVPAAQDQNRKSYQAQLHEQLYTALVDQDSNTARHLVETLLADIVNSLHSSSQDAFLQA